MVFIPIGYLYLDYRQLKILSNEIKNIAGEEIKETLNEYLTENENKRNGNYLNNIFNDKQLNELRNLKENYILISL